MGSSRTGSSRCSTTASSVRRATPTPTRTRHPCLARTSWVSLASSCRWPGSRSQWLASGDLLRFLAWLSVTLVAAWCARWGTSARYDPWRRPRGPSVTRSRSGPASTTRWNFRAAAALMLVLFFTGAGVAVAGFRGDHRLERELVLRRARLAGAGRGGGRGRRGRADGRLRRRWIRRHRLRAARRRREPGQRRVDGRRGPLGHRERRRRRAVVLRRWPVGRPRHRVQLVERAGHRRARDR